MEQIHLKMQAAIQTISEFLKINPDFQIFLLKVKDLEYPSLMGFINDFFVYLLSQPAQNQKIGLNFLTQCLTQNYKFQPDQIKELSTMLPPQLDESNLEFSSEVFSSMFLEGYNYTRNLLKYKQISQMIRSSQNYKSKPQDCEQICTKVDQVFQQRGREITTANDFDNWIEQALEGEEKDWYDEIVLADESNKPNSQNTQGGQFQVAKEQLNEFPNLSERFNTTMYNLIKRRQRIDLENQWNICIGWENLEKYLKIEPIISQANQEFLSRIEIFKLINRFYEKILLNFLEIKGDVKQKKKQVEARQLIEFIKKIVAIETNSYIPQEQNEFFTFCKHIKFFYKYLKLRYQDGKGIKKIQHFNQERETAGSMKKILLKYIQRLFGNYLQDQLFKQGSIYDIFKTLYQSLKIKTNEVEYKQIFNLIMDVKIFIVKFYKFRTCFYFMISHIYNEYRGNTEIIDIIVNQYQKFLFQIQNQHESVDLGEQASKLWEITKIVNIESIQPESMQVFVDRMQKRNDEFSRKTNSVITILEGYFKNVTNKGLWLQMENTKQSKIWQKSQDIIQDIFEVETKILIQSKDLFGSPKHFQINFKNVLREFQNKLSQEKTDKPERLERIEIFQWLEFMRNKQKTLFEPCSKIQSQEVRSESQVLIENTLIWDPKRVSDRFKALRVNCYQQDQQQIDKILKTLDQEQRINKIMKEYLFKFQLNLEKLVKKQHLQCAEILKFHSQYVINDEWGYNQSFFYFPANLFFQLYLQRDIKDFYKLIQQLHEFIEKFRYYVIGLIQAEPETGDYQEKIANLISSSNPENFFFIEHQIHSYTLEFQYQIAQNLYNYYVNLQILIGSQNPEIQKNNYILWDDPFPKKEIDPNNPYQIRPVNTIQFNLANFLALLVLNIKSEFKIQKNLDSVSKLIKAIKDNKYSSDDPKILQEFQKVFEIPIKTYLETRDYKLQLETEAQSNPTQQRWLYEIFSKYYSQTHLYREVDKKKREFLIPLNKTEIYAQSFKFFENRFSQFLQTNPLQQVSDNLKQKLQTIFRQIKTSEKSGYEYYKELKQTIDSHSKDSFFKESLQLYSKSFDVFFPQSTQIIEQSQPVHPKPQRPAGIANQSKLEEKIVNLRKKHNLVQSDNQKLLADYIIEKLGIYMKSFMSKVFQAAIAQNPGDEIKVFQVTGQQQIIEPNSNIEQKIKQLSEFQNVYGPRKESDIEATLLTNGTLVQNIFQAEQSQNQVQYSLCDITPISRQQDFHKFLMDLDLQQEEIQKNHIRSKKWREDKPELIDTLTKKIKRGTDLGDAVQHFLLQRYQQQNDDGDTQISLENLDDSVNLKAQLVKNLQKAQETSLTSSKTQMQNKLKNFESNNHLYKRKEISVKTVQFVLQNIPYYRKSKILQKSYLF